MSDVEENCSDDNDNNGARDVSSTNNLNRKRVKKKQSIQSRKRHGGIKLDNEDQPSVDGNTKVENGCDNVENNVDNEEHQKAKANALWADFLKDVDSKASSKVVSRDLLYLVGFCIFLKV